VRAGSAPDEKAWNWLSALVARSMLKALKDATLRKTERPPLCRHLFVHYGAWTP
jgi:hypothetical protein